MKMNERITDS